MIDQALHDKIEAYLLGDLPPAEADAFEKQIANNPELAEEVELHRLILPVPDRLAELDLQQDFARWQRELDAIDPPPKSPPPAPKPGYAKFWLAAPVLLLLAGAFGLWQYYEGRIARERAERQRLEQALEAEKRKSDTQEQEIRQLREDLLRLQQTAPGPAIKPATPPGRNQQAAAVQPPAPEWTQLADQELIAYADVMLESLRGRGVRSDAGGEELVDKADTAILNKKYREATKLLTRVKADDPLYPKSLEMLAYVYFKRKLYAQAVDAYRKYRVFDGDTDKTDWDLCLFYLADYQRYRSEFQELLNKITGDAKHPRRDKALALRDALAEKGIWPR